MFSRLIGLLAVIPASVLLTISFFVLLVLRKVEEKGLRIFGKIVAGLLCISAGVVLAGGLNVLVTGKQMIKCPMMMGMKSKNCKMMPMMQEKRELLFREQTPLRTTNSVKQNKESKNDDSACVGNKGIVSKGQ